MVGNLENHRAVIRRTPSVYFPIHLSIHAFTGTCRSMWAEFLEGPIIPDHASAHGVGHSTETAF